LPEIPPAIPGAWPTLLSVGSGTSQTLQLVARDHRFGDLVSVPLNANNEWGAVKHLDGVPTGPVVGSPTGPRGGVIAPGPDVGQFASAVSTNAGYAAVARDDTADMLRFVSVGSDGERTAYVLDPCGAGWVHCGNGASLAQSPNQSLHVLSFASTDEGIHVVRYSQTAPGDDSPLSVDAWATNSFTWSLGSLVSSKPCTPSCGLFQACVSVDNESICVLPDITDTCDPGCAVGHACVEAVCRPIVRPSADIRPWKDSPAGETAAVFVGQSLVMAYEDMHQGALSMIQTEPWDWMSASPVVLDGGSGVRVGRHLAADGTEDGHMALVYQDSTHQRLRLIWGQLQDDLVPWDIEEGGIGADVVILPQNTLAIAHGVTNGRTVRLLIGTPGSWEVYEPDWTPHVGRFNALVKQVDAIVWVSVGHQLSDTWNLVTSLNVDSFPTVFDM